MAYPGQVLDNPVSGERIVFHQTAAQTNGELLSLELRLAADGQVPGAHVHPSQQERFRVESGTMRFRRGFRTIVARRGDVVTVPPRTPHRFENIGGSPARVLVEVRPALRVEYLFETTAELAQEGRTNRKGLPRPLELALFMREFQAEIRAPFVPAALARLAMAPLAWLARRRGISLRRAREEEMVAALHRRARPPARPSAAARGRAGSQVPVMRTPCVAPPVVHLVPSPTRRTAGCTVRADRSRQSTGFGGSLPRLHGGG